MNQRNAARISLWRVLMARSSLVSFSAREKISPRWQYRWAGRNEPGEEALNGATLCSLRFPASHVFHSSRRTVCVTTRRQRRLLRKLTPYV